MNGLSRYIPKSLILGCGIAVLSYGVAVGAPIKAEFEGFIDQIFRDDASIAMVGDTFTGNAIYDVLGPSNDFSSDAAYIWSGTFNIDVFAPNSLLRSTSSFSVISTLQPNGLAPSHILINNNRPIVGGADAWELYAARDISARYERFHMSIEQNGGSIEPLLVDSLTADTVPNFSLIDSSNFSWYVGPPNYSGNVTEIFQAHGEITSLIFSSPISEPTTITLLSISLFSFVAMRSRNRKKYA